MRILPTFRFLIISAALVLAALTAFHFTQPAPAEEEEDDVWELAHCIDTQEYRTWHAVLAEIKRFYHSPGPKQTLTVRLTHGRKRILEMDAGRPYGGAGRQFYIHCCNEGILWCEVPSPIPEIVNNDEQYTFASFFRTDKVQTSKWSELQNITNVLKNAGVCRISISAEEDFIIAEKAAGLRELFGYPPDRKAPAIFNAYIFICPKTPAPLPEWMNNTSPDSPLFRQAIQKLAEAPAQGPAFTHELVHLCNESPHEMARFLLTNHSLHADIIRHAR